MSRPIYTYNRIDTDGNILDSGTAKFYAKTYGISYQVIYESYKNNRLVGRSFRFTKGEMIPQPEKRRSSTREKTRGLIPKTKSEIYTMDCGVVVELIYGSSGNLINTKFLKQA